jgi:hypothetical protein
MQQNVMTFVPRNLHWQSEDLQEWGKRGKKMVKRNRNKVDRLQARLDIRTRQW